MDPHFPPSTGLKVAPNPYRRPKGAHHKGQGGPAFHPVSVRTRTLPILLICLLLFAGCTKPAPDPADVTDPTEPQGLVPSDGDEAAMEGFVYGPDVLPIANVTIHVGGANTTSVLSDASGYYAVFPIPSGSYHVFVNESRYVPLHRNVTLGAGETRRLDFALRDIPAPEPYVDDGYTRRATLTCRARANGTGTETNPSCTDIAPDRTGEYLPPATGPNVTIGPAVQGVSIELQWTASIPTTNSKLRLALRPTNSETWRQVEGTSVLKVVLQKSDLDAIKAKYAKDYATDGGQMFFEIYPGEAAAAPGQGGAGATVIQDYTLYISVFYRMPVPQGYTRLGS